MQAVKMGSALRCPTCNQYKPDRCTCKPPTGDIMNDIDKDAEAFERHLGCKPERIKSATHGWRYADISTQRSFNEWRARPAVRYEHVNGFDDADYVEFRRGAEFGHGVKDGVAYEQTYHRDEAERYVQRGFWREVPVPAAPAETRNAAADATISDAARALARQYFGSGIPRNAEISDFWCLVGQLDPTVKEPK